MLIANQGEIALRILRTLRDMGIEAAIIHGREDRLSLPVQMADIAYPNYRTNPLDSYLDIEAVVQAAKELECDAVHPGYGFSAENAAFVARLEEEGITFIGPASGVITLLGDKIEARAAMEAAGLPTAKGSSNPLPAPMLPVRSLMKSAILSSSRRLPAEGVSACKSFRKPTNSRVPQTLSVPCKIGVRRRTRSCEKYIQGAQHVEFKCWPTARTPSTLASVLLDSTSPPETCRRRPVADR